VFNDVSYPFILFVVVSIFVILQDNFFFSRKNKGHKPTGQPVQAARNAGYSSVLEMLNVKGPDNLSQLRGC
jgi:hypothetical protein